MQNFTFEIPGHVFNLLAHILSANNLAGCIKQGREDGGTSIELPQDTAFSFIPDSEVPKLFGKGSMVEHPAHYGGATNPYEMIKVAEAWLTPEEYVGAMKFQVWKYTQRWPNKTPGAEDLAKAKWYLEELLRVNKGVA